MPYGTNRYVTNRYVTNGYVTNTNGTWNNTDTTVSMQPLSNGTIYYAPGFSTYYSWDEYNYPLHLENQETQNYLEKLKKRIYNDLFMHKNKRPIKNKQLDLDFYED